MDGRPVDEIFPGSRDLAQSGFGSLRTYSHAIPALDASAAERVADAIFNVA